VRGKRWLAVVAAVMVSAGCSAQGSGAAPPARPPGPGRPGPAAGVFGRAVTLPGELVTVAAPVVDTDDPEAIAHPKTGRFVSFLVTVVAGPSAPVEYGQSEFYVRAAGGLHEQAWVAGGARGPLLGSGTLRPGERVSGWLVFDVALHGTLVLDSRQGAGSAVEWQF
jgi:hypothetical protein